MEDQLRQIGQWSRQTRDGSRSDLRFQPLPTVWDPVHSDSGNCLGRACPDYADCFYFKARKQMFGANLLIVNHALFFSDLALRRQGGSLLPDYQVVIFDEAHTLEDVAADHLGLQFSRGSLDYLLNKLYNPRGRRVCSPTSPTTTPSPRSRPPARPASASSRPSSPGTPARRDPPAGRRRRMSNDSVRVREPAIVPDILSEELTKLASRIAEAGENLEDEHKIEFTSLAERARKLAVSVKQWLAQGLEGQVYWIDVSAGGAPQGGAGQRPHRGWPRLAGTALQQGADGDHDQRHAAAVGRVERLPPLPGAARPGRLRDPAAGQPVQLPRAGRTAPLPPHARSVRDPAGYEEAVLDKIPEYVDRSKGRAFVLFTSYAIMQKAAARLKPWCAEQRLSAAQPERRPAAHADGRAVSRGRQRGAAGRG